MTNKLFLFVLLGTAFGQTRIPTLSGDNTFTGTNIFVNTTIPMPVCATTPPTTGGYRAQCLGSDKSVYTCANAAGCTVSGDWGSGGGGGGLTPAGSNGDVQMKSGSSLAAAGVNCVSGSCTFGATLLVDATWGLLVPGAAYTSGPVTVQKVGYYDNNAAGALTFNLPSLGAFNFGAGYEPQFCFANSVGKSGAITIKMPTSTFLIVSGVVGSAAGTYVSGGALGDGVCVRGVDATHYIAYPGSGNWTNN